MHFSDSFDTETLDEFAFYIGVHILSRYIEFEKSPVVVVLQFSQPAQNHPAVLFRNDPLFPEHNRVGLTPPDIVGNQHFITGWYPSYVSTGQKIENSLGRGLAHSFTPEFLNFHFLSFLPGLHPPRVEI